jgi:hypothetical protein
MKKQRGRYAVLRRGLVTPVSLLRSKVEQKKLRDVTFKDVNVYALSLHEIQETRA